MSETAAQSVKFLSSIEIEKKAREVRQAKGLDTIPVKVTTLAISYGIVVRGASFKSPTDVGLLRKADDEVTIYYRQTDIKVRSRFTIAHELGHYFLHFADGPRFVDNEVNFYRLQAPEGHDDVDAIRREIQANEFAAALLMPERQVKQFWAEIRSILQMARLFKVSRQAMGIRVAALGLG